MRQLPTLSDFSFGELMPELFGMVENPVYRKGAMQFVNFAPRRQGGFTKPPGTVYQGHTGSDAVARIHELVVNITTSYVVEFTNNKIRFWKWNGTGLTYLAGQDITTTYASADLNSLQFAWSYPYFFIAHQGYAPAVITWATGDNFTLSTIGFTGANPEFYTGNITTLTTVTLTVGHLIQDADGTWNSYIGRPVTGTGIPGGTTISSITLQVVVYGSLDQTGSGSTGTYGGGSPSNAGTVVYGGMGPADEGDAVGFVLSASSTNASGVSLTISDAYLDGQTPVLPFQTANNYPRSVCVAFQRVFWGGTINQPLSFWGSIVGIFDQFGYMQMGTYETVTNTISTMNVDISGQPVDNPPTYTTTVVSRNIIGDSDGMYFTLNSDKNDEVQWIAPDVDLFIGSASGMWVMPSNSTANDFNVQLVSRMGSAPIQGSMIEGGCVFVNTFARRVGQIGWQGIYNPWVPPDDLTFYANQMMNLSSALMWDFRQNPSTELYFVRSDGQLACLSMDTAHGVRAWWHRTTNGTITSLAVIPGANRDVVVLSVTRNNGTVNVLEIVDDGSWYNPANTNNGEVSANYMDSVVKKTSGSTFTSVTGLTHLNGMTVGMLGDGAYLGTATVLAGAVTLPTASKVAIVGLLFTSTFQSMPLDFGDSANSSIGVKKSTVRARVRLYNTLDCQVGTDGSTWQTAEVGGASVALANPALFTGDEDVPIDQQPRTPAYVYLQSAQPLPCSVSAIEIQMDVAAEDG